MKHIVSFETAKKLEIAGFERPKPEIGQFWYTPLGLLYPITAISGNDIFVRWHGSGSWDAQRRAFEEEYKDWIYAPTATDLIEQLNTVWLAKDIGGLWRCFKIGTTTMVGYNANAAEAVAEAYLSQTK